MGNPADPTGRDSSAGADTPIDDRLDSWKEIAAFLKRDVRTVQRWEKHAGLPVHRHTESRLRTAYAYRSEIEDWWRKYRAMAEAGGADAEGTAESGSEETAESGEVGTPSRARWRTASVAIAGSLAIVAGLLWLVTGREPAAAPATAEGAPVSVIVADFTNLTDEAGLDLRLKEEVRHQLARHPQVQVLPPGRIVSLLRLTKRAPETPVTPEVARELALRDGRARAVIAGRVRKSNERYHVEFEVIDPEEGSLRAVDEREVPGERELRVTVRDETERIARRLVEMAREEGPFPRRRIEEVSTPSLSAARLYSEAVAAGAESQWSASELLARQALAADTEFAAGYAWLAVTLRNQGHPADKCLEVARRAVALSTAGTERENYVISGTFFEMQGDLARTLGAYEALLRVAPDDARTLDLLVNGYSRAGRFGTAVERAVARADAQQDDFYGNVRAAHALFTWQSDKRRADPFVRRARSLLSTRPGVERPRWKAWLRVLPVFERWLADDPRAASELLTPLDAALSQPIGRERDALATAVGSSYLALGRLEDAERAFRFASAPVRQLNLAMLALTLDDDAGARAVLGQVRSAGRERPLLFAAAGLLDEAESGLVTTYGSDYREGIHAATRGLIAEKRGRRDEAIGLLRTGTDLLRPTGEPEYFLAARTQARLLADRGDERRALRLLEEASQQRSRTYGSVTWSGGEWARTAADLMRLYTRIGRAGDAARVRAILRAALKEADPGHPVLGAVVTDTR